MRFPSVRGLTPIALRLTVGALFASIVFGVFGFLNPVFAEVGGESLLKPITSILNSILHVVLDFLGNIFLFVSWGVIKVGSYNSFLDSTAVARGWAICRDVANMFFIVIMLVIAVSTVLGNTKYGGRQNLMHLIFIAIFVNFSKTVCGLIIDVSQVVMLTFMGAISDVGGGNFSALLGIPNLYAISKSATVGGAALDGTAIFVTYMMAAIFLIIAIVVVGVMFFTLLMRIVTLWFLIALSPLAFVASLTDRTKSHYAKWWNDLIQNAVVGPVLAFFLWLAFALVPNTKDGRSINIASEIGGASSPDLPAIGASALGQWENVLGYAIGISMLIGGLLAAQEAGGKAGKLAGDWAGKVQANLTGKAGLSKKVKEGVKTAAKSTALKTGGFAAGALGELGRRGRDRIAAGKAGDLYRAGVSGLARVPIAGLLTKEGRDRLQASRLAKKDEATKSLKDAAKDKKEALAARDRIGKVDGEVQRLRDRASNATGQRKVRLEKRADINANTDASRDTKAERAAVAKEVSDEINAANTDIAAKDAAIGTKEQRRQQKLEEAKKKRALLSASTVKGTPLEATYRLEAEQLEREAEQLATELKGEADAVGTARSELKRLKDELAEIDGDKSKLELAAEADEKEKSSSEKVTKSKTLEFQASLYDISSKLAGGVGETVNVAGYVDRGLGKLVRLGDELPVSANKAQMEAVKKQEDRFAKMSKDELSQYLNGQVPTEGDEAQMGMMLAAMKQKIMRPEELEARRQEFGRNANTTTLKMFDDATSKYYPSMAPNKDAGGMKDDFNKGGVDFKEVSEGTVARESFVRGSAQVSAAKLKGLDEDKKKRDAFSQEAINFIKQGQANTGDMGAGFKGMKMYKQTTDGKATIDLDDEYKGMIKQAAARGGKVGAALGIDSSGAIPDVKSQSALRELMIQDPEAFAYVMATVDPQAFSATSDLGQIVTSATSDQKKKVVRGLNKLTGGFSDKDEYEDARYEVLTMMLEGLDKEDPLAKMLKTALKQD